MFVSDLLAHRHVVHKHTCLWTVYKLFVYKLDGPSSQPLRQKNRRDNTFTHKNTHIYIKYSGRKNARHTHTLSLLSKIMQTFSHPCVYRSTGVDHGVDETPGPASQVITGVLLLCLSDLSSLSGMISYHALYHRYITIYHVYPKGSYHRKYPNMIRTHTLGYKRDTKTYIVRYISC